MLAACAGGGDPATVQTTASASGTLPADQAIAALVYDADYQTPPGFYVDERAGTPRSYTLHHVLDESGSYELCSDDYAEALAWEAADSAARGVQGYYVESRDSDRYFEFVRELAYENDIGNVDDLTSPGFGRVFKCSSIDRTGVDRSLVSGYAGRVNARPLDSDAVRIFSEYLWQFAFFPAGRRKVLSSFGSEHEEWLEHTLHIALAVTRGAGDCDRIEVASWRFTADRATGDVAMRFSILRSFDALLDDDAVQICR